jgi:dienelactone hydrolase
MIRLQKCALLAFFSLSATLAATLALAQSADIKSVPSRIEVHTFPSLTITDTQFLNGDANGKSVTLTGTLSIAQGSGKLPVAILMHGSGGIGANIPPWVQALNANGISTFTIDGFTGRGLTGVGTNQILLGRLNFTLDMYRALEVLAKHPRIDANRVALIGFSRGGQGVLFASLERFHKLWNTSGVGIQAYIPFYPDCGTAYRGDTATTAAPIRIHHGEPDDYNPLKSCLAYVDRLKTAGRDVTITTYPDAQHGFDSPLAPPKAVSVDNQSVRDCDIKEGNSGALINASTNQPFTYQDACVRLNPHVGGNAAATTSARAAVLDTLRDVFKLK